MILGCFEFLFIKEKNRKPVNIYGKPSATGSTEIAILKETEDVCASKWYILYLIANEISLAAEEKFIYQNFVSLKSAYFFQSIHKLQFNIKNFDFERFQDFDWYS